MLLCQGKAGDGKQSLWVVPFLWTETPWTHCKVCWQEKSSFFSTQPAMLLSSPFCSVACLWLPESMELPSYILKGLLRNPPVCGFFIQSALLSLFTFECQSLPLFLSASVCISLKKVLLHSTIQFLFFSLFTTCPLRCRAPSLFSHHLAPIFFLPKLFWLLFSRFKLLCASLKASPP